jgi:pimeloyl-ACP methyl ester carboxylesterase
MDGPSDVIQHGKATRLLPRTRARQAPVLIVHGEDDLLPEQNSRMYADCFPNARLHMMRKRNSAGGVAGHFLFDDQPEM